MAVQSLADKFGVRLSAGTTVFRQDDPGGSIYVIRAGRVRVIKEAHGRRRIVAKLGPGDFFGEMAAVTGRPRSATVEVIEDAELLKVPAAKLQEMVTSAGEIAIRLIRHLAERLEGANRFIDVLLEDDITARVVLELQDTLHTVDGATMVGIQVSDLVLALGTDKNEIWPALRRLSRVGIIEVCDGRVAVKAPERLGEFLNFIRNAGKP